MAKHIHIHIPSSMTKDAGFDESKHKRDHGKFSTIFSKGEGDPDAPAVEKGHPKATHRVLFLHHSGKAYAETHHTSEASANKYARQEADPGKPLPQVHALAAQKPAAAQTKPKPMHPDHASSMFDIVNNHSEYLPQDEAESLGDAAEKASKGHPLTPAEHDQLVGLMQDADANNDGGDDHDVFKKVIAHIGPKPAKK